jgi:hypothetical protein
VNNISQYLYYKFDSASTTITNYGDGGAGYNGQAARSQKNEWSWGPLTDNYDGIMVPGIISPYNHTWQMHINIARWWPILGVDSSGILCGSDGKLWSAGNNQFYGYLHNETNNMVETGLHYFTIEIVSAGGAGASAESIQFYLGTNGGAPVKVPADQPRYEMNQVYWSFSSAPLQLNTDYYFQVSVNLDPGQWAGIGNYSIGNCLFSPGSPCADTMVTGFPCGCYIYSWRENSDVLDLSQGGDWAVDMAGGGASISGGGSSTPAAAAPAIPQPTKFISIAFSDATKGETSRSVKVNDIVKIVGKSGYKDPDGTVNADVNLEQVSCVRIRVDRGGKEYSEDIGTQWPNADGTFEYLVTFDRRETIKYKVGLSGA